MINIFYKQTEKELRDWFPIITKKYQRLKIKFEFSNDLCVWVVSFSSCDGTLETDNFCIDAMAFADDMNLKYGNYAPLFTDNEELFKLSQSAETVGPYFATEKQSKKVAIGNPLFGFKQQVGPSI